MMSDETSQLYVVVISYRPFTSFFAHHVTDGDPDTDSLYSSY